VHGLSGDVGILGPAEVELGIAGSAATRCRKAIDDLAVGCVAPVAVTDARCQLDGLRSDPDTMIRGGSVGGSNSLAFLTS